MHVFNNLPFNWEVFLSIKDMGTSALAPHNVVLRSIPILR